MPKTIPPVLAAGLCLALGACGDEPSPTAMKRAFSGVFARMSPPEVAVANLQFGGKRAGHVDELPEIANLRKIGCAPAQPNDGHVCAFAVTLNGIDRPKIKARFFKGADGNLVMDN